MIISLPLLPRQVHLSSEYDLRNLLSAFRRDMKRVIQEQISVANCRMSMSLAGFSAVGKPRFIATPEYEVNVHNINALFESIMKMANIRSGLILNTTQFYIRQLP